MATLDQVAHGGNGAGVIVRSQRGYTGAGNVAHDEHDRNAGGNERREIRGFRSARRGYDEPRHPVLAHRSDDLALAVELLARIREELHETGRLHDLIDADREFRKEAVREIVDDDADDLRSRLAQIGGAAIIHIAELTDHCIDLRPRRFIDERTCLQHKRHGRLRHAGGARDVDNRHRSFPMNILLKIHLLHS